MDYTEIVDKLIGPIWPMGKTEVDDERFHNLKETCILMEHLFDRITEVAQRRDEHQHSVKKAANYAADFLDQIHETLNINPPR